MNEAGSDSNAGGQHEGSGEAPRAAAVRSWLTLANAFTATRLALAPVSVGAIFAERWQLAAAVFVCAVASDFLDGFFARRRRTASPLGGAFDHGVDALYVAATLWAIAYTEAQTRADVVPGILPWFIALAFLQYLLDSRALAGKALRGSRLGRVNGIAYFALVGAIVIRNALDLRWLPDEAIYWAALAILVSTLASMLNRLRLLPRGPVGVDARIDSP